MKCTILTVGTEILFGSIVNTNAVFLSKKLNELGIDVMYHMTVGDNTGRLREVLAHAYEDCDLIITTGGLGPTQDDLTKETIAEFFGVRNLRNDEELRKLSDWFKAAGRVMAENNKKQANFPEGAVILNNPNGTAPGFYLEKDGRCIACLPGPPFEMQPMFTNELAPILSAHSDGYLYYKMIRTSGIGESDLETKLLPLIDGQTDPTFATYASKHECSLRVASKRRTREEAEAAVEAAMTEVRKLVGEYIYSEDGEDISQVVLKKLMAEGMSLSSCESITGGLFAKTVTDMPGVSAIFDRSIVTYSNRAKMEELGVKAETIERFGPVSEETAFEMAQGLYKVTGSDVCVSVTGLAGPQGDGSDKPVGQVYIGVCYKGNTKVFDHFFRRNNREFIRTGAVSWMFRDIYSIIQ